MANLMNKMVLSCKKAAELTDKNLMGHLTLIESFQLKIHRFICTCKICAKYGFYSEKLDDALCELGKTSPKKHILSDDKKEEIIKAIQSKN